MTTLFNILKVPMFGSTTGCGWKNDGQNQFFANISETIYCTWNEPGFW